jgi:hypothetical protein
VMFVISFVFLGGLLIALRRQRERQTIVALATLGFAAVSLPYVATLSLQRHRPTFGDAGKLTYAWFVNEVTFVHWQGGPASAGAPRHPTRLVHEHPRVYEFASPFASTYPPWFDPSYWHEGLRIRPDLPKQALLLVDNLAVVLKSAGLALFVAVVMTAWARTDLHGKATLGQIWTILLPSAAAFLLYGSIFVENRYLAPFYVLAAAVALTLTLAAHEPTSLRIIATGALAGAFVLAGPVLIRDLRRLLSASSRPPHMAIAEEVRALGIQAGSRISLVGDGFRAYWAQIAGARIVAEIPVADADVFVSLSEDKLANVLRVLRRSGAQFVFVEGVVPESRTWSRVGTSNLFVLRL